MGLRIYDSKRREKLDFMPIEEGKVRMYLCGITPYAPSHIGHARSAVAFDVVFRWMKKHFVVTYVRNYTDIDDKIIKASNEEKATCEAISERYIQQYMSDLKELNCLAPDVEPRVSTHVDDVVDTIERLIDNGLAYAVDGGDVYYDVPAFSAYGQLSGRTLDNLKAGSRVEVDERKKSPFDFALWKAAKPGEPAFDSPWGRGRPGWHIECSAMANKYLGKTFDIHGGGRDLIFPHHENEIAQSCGAYGVEQYSNWWLHNGFVNLIPEACPKCDAELPATETTSCKKCEHTFTEDELKMSKSRGNFFPVREMLQRFEGEALRLLFLNSHYRKDIAFAPKLLLEAEKRLDRHYEMLQEIEAFVGQQTFIPGDGFAKTFDFDPSAEIAAAMDDDFNASLALAAVEKVFTIAGELIKGDEKKRIDKTLSPEDTSRLLAEAREIIREASDVLGLWQHAPSAYLGRRQMVRADSLELTPAQIESLIAQRAQARKSKDFARADEIRDELREKGVILEDSPDGTTWTIDA